MASFATKAVVYGPDGSLFYREEHEWANVGTEAYSWFEDRLNKHDQYLKQLEKDQKKTPEAVFSAVLSRTGSEDLHFKEFTFDSFQKAHREWNKMGEEVMKIMEQIAKKA